MGKWSLAIFVLLIIQTVAAPISESTDLLGRGNEEGLTAPPLLGALAAESAKVVAPAFSGLEPAPTAEIPPAKADADNELPTLRLALASDISGEPLLPTGFYEEQPPLALDITPKASSEKATKEFHIFLLGAGVLWLAGHKRKVDPQQE